MMDAGSTKKISLPIFVDIGMIIALATLSFWVGRQADRIDNVISSTSAIQAQVAVMAQNDTKADIAALKERTANEDAQIIDLKDFVRQRLDRLEVKVEAIRR